MNKIDLDELQNEILKQVADRINSRFKQNCDHIFKPAKDGTGDLKCTKCGQRAMQARAHQGLRTEYSCIDEYHRMCVECNKNQNQSGIKLNCSRCEYNLKIKSKGGR